MAMSRATLRQAQETGPIRFVDTEAAAGYLALETHTLECYRSLSDSPSYNKFGKYVRYTVDGLDAWAASCRRVTTAPPVAPRILPIGRFSSTD
jgi:hypothetical protein